MYYYFFDRYYGHDRVAQAHLDDVQAWDFFEAVGYGYVLCLWDSLSRVEQYGKYIEPGIQKAELLPIQKWLLSQQSLEMMHWFTHHRFCAYKKALPLYISDPEEIAKRKTKKMKKKKWENKDEQKLIIYPNLRSLQNDASLDLTESGTIFLHSQSTKKQKSEGFRKIRNGVVDKLVCTYSQMLQDWDNLVSVTLIDQHTRYYKSPQDPRYEAGAVVDMIWEIYGSKTIKTGYDLSLDVDKIWQNEPTSVK